MFFEKGGKGKRGTHYYNIEGKEERRKEGKKTRRTKRKERDTDRRKREKQNLVKGFYYSQKHL